MFKKGDTVIITGDSPKALSKFKEHGLQVGDTGVVKGNFIRDMPYIKFDKLEFSMYVFKEEVIVKNKLKIEYEDGDVYNIKNIQHLVINNKNQVITFDYAQVKGGLTVRSNVEITFSCLKSFKFNEDEYVKIKEHFYKVDYALCGQEKTVVF